MKNTNKMLVMLASNPEVSYQTFKSFLRECRIEKLVSPKCCRYLRSYAKLMRGYTFSPTQNRWYFEF